MSMLPDQHAGKGLVYNVIQHSSSAASCSVSIQPIDDASTIPAQLACNDRAELKEMVSSVTRIQVQISISLAVNKIAMPAFGVTACASARCRRSSPHVHPVDFQQQV